MRSSLSGVLPLIGVLGGKVAAVALPGNNGYPVSPPASSPAGSPIGSPASSQVPGTPATSPYPATSVSTFYTVPASLPYPTSPAIPTTLTTVTQSAQPTGYPTGPPTGAPTGNPNPVPYQVKTPPLDTPWTYEVGTNPWTKHPRPQLEREAWKNLNGIWTYQPAVEDADVNNLPTGPLAKEVMIPSCIESGLSGIQELNVTHMWFATTFTVPKDWNKGNSVLLNFDAVDYEATVFINGAKAGFHRGGYFRFTVDATDLIKPGQKNSLLVFVHDPTDMEPYVNPVGKQTRNPSHIWYRSCTGIWQSVWLESVPKHGFITHLDVASDMDGIVTATVRSNADGKPVEIAVLDKEGEPIATGHGKANSQFKFKVRNPDLWSPETPILYKLRVKLGKDVVNSYTGFRTVSRGVVEGVERPLLNGEFVFNFGTLDQGYWPDGIYVAPNLEALVSDLLMLKKYGFNMVRKHVKVEPDVFYHACDLIGLLVYQDMPSLSPNHELPNADQQAEFGRQLEILVQQHRSYPCIVTWVVYNEGWGQPSVGPFPDISLSEKVKQLDPTRLVNAASGWHDHGAGDIHDNHHYASPQCGTPFYSIQSTPNDPKRIALQGEFGGIGENTTIEHLWNVQEAIDTINQTYELNADDESYNYRAHRLLDEFREQVDLFDCSGGVWTQTSDVEGEVNGLITYDRRIERPYLKQWQDDIHALYEAAAKKGGKPAPERRA